MVCTKETKFTFRKYLKVIVYTFVKHGWQTLLAMFLSSISLWMQPGRFPTIRFKLIFYSSHVHNNQLCLKNLFKAKIIALISNLLRFSHFYIRAFSWFSSNSIFAKIFLFLIQVLQTWVYKNLFSDWSFLPKFDQNLIVTSKLDFFFNFLVFFSF